MKISRSRARNRSAFYRALRVESLEDRKLLAGVPELVTDLGAPPTPGGGTVNGVPTHSIQNFVTSGANAYFTISSPATGMEIWKTDGTETGTGLLKDLYAGTNHSIPEQVTAFNGNLLFRGRSGQSAPSLFFSDGTAQGTEEIPSPIPDRGYILPQRILTAGPVGFFIDQDGQHITDGTAEGTWRMSIGVAAATTFNGDVYFTSHNGLWRTDGTRDGTEHVVPLDVTGHQLMVSGGSMYFTSSTTASGPQLWKSDGTPEGTQLVKNVLAQQLTDLNSQLVFSSSDSTNGNELWTSDGTEAGTHLLADIKPGTAGSSAAELTRLGDNLLFTADDGAHGRELWITNGTEAGTLLLKDLAEGTAAGAPSLLHSVGNRVLFRDAAGTLWSSNGTSDGTSPVLDAEGNPITPATDSWTVLNGSLLFQKDYSLWKSDGTQAGTAAIASLPTQGPFPLRLFAFNDSLYFGAILAPSGHYLWRTVGTSQVMEPVDFGLPADAVFGEMIVHQGLLYIGAFHQTDNTARLWRTDGTPGGLESLVSFPGDANNRKSIQQMRGVGDRIVFELEAGEIDQLWSTDGTSAGTQHLHDYRANDFRANITISDLVALGDHVYFEDQDAEGHLTLWKSDGTSTGTSSVVTFPNAILPNSEIAALGDAVYVSAGTTSTSTLWRSDGTAAGTANIAGFDQRASDLTAAGGFLYFKQGTSANIGLWRTDGTTEGVKLLTGLGDDLSYSLPPFGEVTQGAWDGRLYFTKNDGELGEELWSSDGTVEGTKLVADIAQPGGSMPVGFTVLRNKLYFSAADIEHGRALWRISLSDDPALGLTAGPTYVENGAPVHIAPQVTLTDADSANFDGGTLTVTIESGKTADDALAIRNVGTGENQIGVTGNTVTFGGLAIGTFSGGTAGEPLVISLNENATQLRVRYLLRYITFSVAGDAPSTAPREISVLLTDGDGGVSNTARVSVGVATRNDAPTLVNTGGLLTYRENVPLLFAGATQAGDVDLQNFDGGTLTVRFIANSQLADRLFVQNAGRITVSGSSVLFADVPIGTFAGGSNGNALVITFNTAATLNRVQAVLRSLAFDHQGDNPLARTRTVWMRLTDGDGGTSSAVTQDIAVLPVNDAPTLSPAAVPAVDYARGAKAIPLLADAVVADPERNFTGGRLLVRFTDGFSDGNRLLIQGGFTLVGNEIKLGEQTIGVRNANGGVGLTRLEITFTEHATMAIVQRLVRGITFRASGASLPGQRTIEFSLTDSLGAVSNRVTKVVNVT